MDNASGVAVLLDVAASLKKNPENLKRSLLFVFVTGEEKGLLGSKYFAAHPTVDPKSMVADINIDMFRPIVPLKLLTVLGMAESDSRRMPAPAGGGIELVSPVQADPQPLTEKCFLCAAISTVLFVTAFQQLALDIAPTTLGKKQIFQDWLTNRYHAPSDDLPNQPVDLAAAGKYEGHHPAAYGQSRERFGSAAVEEVRQLFPALCRSSEKLGNFLVLRFARSREAL